MKRELTQEQQSILNNTKNKLIVSASAGSGKTFVLIEYLINLICKKGVPLSRMLVLTFTKAAANEMKIRLTKAILEQEKSDFLLEQLDDVSISDISTIDAFCEKLLKRNINKLEIDNNFVVLDEKTSKNLKFISFNRAFDKLSQENNFLFDEVYFAFKRNKEQIFECLLGLQSFLDSSIGSDELLNSFENDFNLFHQKAINYLNEKLKNELKKIKLNLSLIPTEELPDVYKIFKSNLNECAEIEITEDFIVNCQKINDFNLMATPRNKIEDKTIKEELVIEKDRFKNLQKLTANFEYTNSAIIEKMTQNNLLRGIIKIYREYEKEYVALKNGRSGVDFSDLEKFAEMLLSDEEVKKSLQDKYDYIFIDEYQDTNTLQASIIKPIAESGKFIAVGDPKQGIYGFRNASMEIMQKDIKDFSNSNDGQALFLRGNFRSDDKILSFVNSIFEKLMKEDNVGIDYKNTSMLKGLSNFEDDGYPAVVLDFVATKEKESKTPSGVYSVKEDEIKISSKHHDEVLAICSRVEELLSRQIYDVEKKKLRPVQEGDIALLFRERNQTMKECVRYMQEKGFNIVADVKQSLLEDGQIQLLVSLLKISINKDDDISLVAVMNSWFGGFSLDEICVYRENYREENFSTILNKCQDEKILRFNNMLKAFTFDCQVFGITKAFYKLFAKSNFKVYLNSLPDANLKIKHINELFKLIKGGDYEYNAGGLVRYLESVKSEGSISESASNAITITTIHATKGLEYPIVILASCGESLGKIDRRNYNISKEFGVGTYLYDFNENIKVTSPTYLANKLYRKRKEFIDEIMIFYVALTRAKNHLILIGQAEEKGVIVSDDVFDNHTYFDMIMSSFGKNFKEQLFNEEYIRTQNYEFNVITEIEEKESCEKKYKELPPVLLTNSDEILKYIDFSYPEKDFCQQTYKNSVSSILASEDHYEQNLLEKLDEERVKNRDEAILRGNAYHEALKFIDFSKINSFQDLLDKKSFLIENMTEGYFDYLDFDIIYKNIMLIKSVVKDGKVYKERQFIMQTCPQEIGLSTSTNEVIVQGVVDLFSLGDENILIDYKFTSAKDENVIKERYSKQIELYSLALEKGFNIKIDKKYLLSLKYANLIRL